MQIREVLKLAVVFFGLLLQSCSDKVSEPEGRIAGSEWLDASRGGSTVDVLAYPLTEDELTYFESMLPAIEQAANKYPKSWDRIAEAEDPALASASGPIWSEAQASGRDIIAVMLKLTFLREFGSSDEPVVSEMKRNLAWLEERLKGDEGSEELQETANQLRALIKVVEAHNEAETFAYYSANQERIDAALDRFTAIGEE